MKKKLFILSSPFLIVILLFILVNLFIMAKGLDKKATWLDSTLLNTEYSPDFLTWSFPHCHKDPEGCYFPEEKIVSSQMEIFQPTPQFFCQNQFDRILFLGDDMTAATEIKENESYASIFAQSYATQHQKCVKLLFLDGSGAGSDQELAVFKNKVRALKPKIVMWQFSFGTNYSNVTNSVYDIKEGKLVHKNIWPNTFFLAGYLNQKIPLLRYTPLGKYIQYLGETKDLFHYSVFPSDNIPAGEKYSEEKIFLTLQEAEALSKKYNFSLFTLLEPVECKLNPKVPCTHEGNAEEFHTSLEALLQKESHYLPVTEPNFDQSNSECSLDEKLDNYMFVKGGAEYLEGIHSLSPQGHACLGKMLFRNFMKNEKTK
jgi:hypothetical protein